MTSTGTSTCSFVFSRAQSGLATAIALVCALGGAMQPARAADITVQPAAGNGFVIKDTAGSNERLRVQESGAISLPGVPAAPSQPQGLCMGASGQLGPCSGGTGGSYTAGTGLTLSGTTFSVAPTYRLPQSCAVNQIPQWNGTAWGCASMSSVTMPVGATNQTLRYDASNTLMANDLLRAFADGSLVASGTLDTGSIPATGPGARLMWYPAKAAFRVGYLTGMQWDDASIGKYSLATGVNTTASGQVSTALGSHTTASGDTSTAMGGGAAAIGDYSTAMGIGTQASGRASVAMGAQTTASADSSFAMGFATEANGIGATALGENSIANGIGSTAMGQSTTAGGVASTAMGFGTIADGDFSTAMGYNVTTNHHVGSFIYGDRAHASVRSNNADNQFSVIANGGVYFESKGTSGLFIDVPEFHFLTNGGYIASNNIGTAGVQLVSGAGSWTTLSDRNAKTAIEPVDARQILKKVAALPLNTWQYKTQDAKYRHMGPMAQDFYAAFQLGESDKGIDTVDADGVALAAIQGVSALLTEKDEQIAALREEKNREISALRAEKDREITALNAELVMQKTRVAALESLAGDLTDIKAQLVALRNSSLSRTAVALREP